MARPKLITNTSVFAKLCTRCPEKGLQLRAAFYKDAQKRDGLSSQCKVCIDATRVRYRGTPAHHAVERRYQTSAKGRARMRANNRLKHTRATYKAAKCVGNARRRARQHGLPATHSQRDELFLRDYWQGGCAVCGDRAGLWKSIALDHWIPLASPDCPGTVPGNMVPLCHARKGIRSAIPDCNVSKSGHDPLVWLIEKLGKRQAARKLVAIQQFFDAAIAYARGEESSGVA
jgi:hypothetical protein